LRKPNSDGLNSDWILRMIGIAPLQLQELANMAVKVAAVEFQQFKLGKSARHSSAYATIRMACPVEAVWEMRVGRAAPADSTTASGAAWPPQAASQTGG
jgi:hypothetical protein